MADGKFEAYEDKGGKWRWRLKGSNGRTVASSGEAFASRGNAERAAKRVKQQAGKAKPPERKPSGATGGRSTPARGKQRTPSRTSRSKK